MKSLILAAALSLCACLGAMPARAEIPASLDGSMMPYPISQEESQPVWADSLKPVYLARVARHGARYISSPDKLTGLEKAVAEARSGGSLSREGLRFDSLLAEVREATGSRWGSLSKVGSEEEIRLAAGLSRLLPSLMKQARVVAISSYVPRVVETMYGFCYELAAESTLVEVATSEGRQFNPLLRCFEADSAYAAWRKDGAWRSVVKAYEDTIVPLAPARRLFGASLPESEARELTMDMYGVLQSLRAMGLPAAASDYMTESEFKACWKASNLTHYLRNTVNPMSAAAAPATGPLLRRIISDADSFLAGENTADANFYFGHAETLMPLLSLMGVAGCSDDSGDISTVWQRWKDYDVVPLGASLDIILLKASSGKVYAALRLNGRFVEPIPGGGLIAPWQAWRAYLEDARRGNP